MWTLHNISKHVFVCVLLCLSVCFEFIRFILHPAVILTYGSTECILIYLLAPRVCVCVCVYIYIYIYIGINVSSSSAVFCDLLSCIGYLYYFSSEGHHKDSRNVNKNCHKGKQNKITLLLQEMYAAYASVVEGHYITSLFRLFWFFMFGK
jgi:hypothetical protein